MLTSGCSDASWATSCDARPATKRSISSSRCARVAVESRRAGASDVEELRVLLDARSIDEQLHVIRAFDWLALLANTAEDVHLERRRRHHRVAGSPSRPGSLAASFDRLAAAEVPGSLISSVVDNLRVSPVITAHPTEVRRQTILHVMNEIADLLDDRSRLQLSGDPELADIDDALGICIVTLWQTALLRLSKLRVHDEINEALRYYDASLFETLPAITAELERMVATSNATRRRAGRTSTARRCQPGGRDGFVDRRGPRRQPVRHRRGRPIRRSPSQTVAFDHHLVGPRTPVARAVDVGPPRHTDRRPCSISPVPLATTRRSAPTSRTARRSAGCMPGCTPTTAAARPTAWRPDRSPTASPRRVRIDRRVGERPRHGGRVARLPRRR